MDLSIPYQLREGACNPGRRFGEKNEVAGSAYGATRKGLRMGRTPAEIAEGAEVYWEGGKGTYIGAVFNNCLGQLNRHH